MNDQANQRAEHVLVAGPSGGGKTTYLGMLHYRCDETSIYLSPHNGDTYPQDIQRARKALIDSGGGQIILDEVQNAPTFLSGEGPTKTLLHEDRKNGVKCVLATQNPQDLRTNENNYGPIQQCDWFVWAGEARTWHRGFRDWLNLDSNQLPDEHYQYHVIRPSDPPEVVHKGETNPDYHIG